MTTAPKNDDAPGQGGARQEQTQGDSDILRHADEARKSASVFCGDCARRMQPAERQRKGATA